MSIVHILFTILELSDHDDLQPRCRSPTTLIKTFVIPSRKYSFPTPTALLIVPYCKPRNICKLRCQPLMPSK